MRRHAIIWLLSVTAMFGGMRALAATPVFETWPPPGDTPSNQSSSSSATPWQDGKYPVWWDVNTDGEPDLVLFSEGGVERVFVDEDGAISAVNVPTSPTMTNSLLGQLTREQHILKPIDIDGDGNDELCAIGSTATMWRIEEDGTIGAAPVPLPAFMSRSTDDAATGDLNRDGLPDIYVTMGRASDERANFSGLSDVVLMNRGDGRFDVVTPLPNRKRLTLGATLVDIDGDGWLDVVESTEASWISGPSALLWNRTQAGDTAPTFEVSEHRWDIGTSGMGVAAGDLNADGHIDLYGTSAGHDLLLMGLGDGRFQDETFARGILHEWSSGGVRIQWSPTMVDLNADGRLDLVVRHGVSTYFTPVVPFSHARDLVYVQQLDGTFNRVKVPDRDEPGNGMRLSVGDLGSDGLPDIARNGLAGTALLWRNVTPKSPTTRVLTVRLAPTVSGSPATGASVVGTCSDTTHTRHITSGGKMGTAEACEAHFAWENCADEVLSIQVRWPSGAVTTDLVAPGPKAWRAEEPRWYQAGQGDAVTLDPIGTGAEEACIATEDGSWTCCTERCDVDRPQPGPGTVRLDDKAPMTLPAREASWLLVTTKHLPTPTMQTAVHMLYVGDPENFPTDNITVEHAGSALSGVSVDEASRMVTVRVSASKDATTIPLTLHVDDNPIASWSPRVGYVFDSEDLTYEIYPTRSTVSVMEDTPWEVHIYPAPGILTYLPTMVLTLSSLDGELIPLLDITSEPVFRRVRIQVKWEDLVGLDTVLLSDSSNGLPVPLPVVQPTNDAALFERIEAAQCGLMRNRMEPAHGGSVGVLTFVDAHGHPLQVPDSLFDLEIEGGVLTGPVTYFPYLKDGLFRVQSGDTSGPGLITVRSKTGEELGRCEFTVSQWPAQPVDVTRSWTTLSHMELDRSQGDTTRLRIGVSNHFGELIGADVWPTVSVEGGVWSDELSLGDGGSLWGTIATTSADTIEIEVRIEGTLLDTHSVAVHGTGDESGGTKSEDTGGCAAGTSWPPGSWLGLLSLAALAMVRRRTRAGH